MSNNGYPVTIRDDAQFNTLVAALKFANYWEDFDFVYESKRDVPSRLHGFTVIASNDPSEPYGALLQVAPGQAETDVNLNYMAYKLLAKIRLN